MRSKAGRGWVVAAVLLTSAVSLGLMFLPTVRTAQVSDGVEQRGWESLIENQGWGFAAVLALPVLVAAVPLLVPTPYRRPVTVGSAILLTAGALVAGFSIGLFYLPSAGLLVVAAVRRQPVISRR